MLEVEVTLAVEVDVEELDVDVLDEVVVVLFTVDVDDVEDEVDEVLVVLMELVVEVAPNGPLLQRVAIG